MIVFGHRGAAGHVAENTVASMRHALATGVDGVEFDVRSLAGRLIALHDDTLERTTDGDGPYKALTVAELRRLKTANGEPVAFLEEILAVVGSCAVVNLEVKEAGIAAAVVAAVDRFVAHAPTWRSEILLSSFDALTTVELARLAGDKRLGILVEDDYQAGLRSAVDLNAYSLHIPLELVSDDSAQQAHEKNLQLYVYTVNGTPDIEKCAACGVDGVFSDFPERVIAFNRRRAGSSR